MEISKNALNEIEEEMVSYLLNLDDMNYTMLCEPVVFGSKPIGMSEIEMERASYLLNLDDMNYSMLCEPLITKYKSEMAPEMSDIRGIEKISLLNGLMNKEASLESMELIDQSSMEFPRRKFHPLRPATLEEEIDEETSYSE